jgi:hypothetical protein
MTRSICVSKNAVISFLLLGGAAGCLFETEFLAYSRCKTAEECGPGWGEQRDALGCFLPESGGGFCTPECEQDDDCPTGEGDAAPRRCRDLAVKDGEGTVMVCVRTCEEGEVGCPEDMVCQEDGLSAVKICVFGDR